MNDLLTINNVAAGAVPGLFDQAMQKVLEDIGDVSKPAEAKRVITITIEIVSEEDRSFAIAHAQAKVKVPAAEGCAGVVNFAIRGGQLEAYVGDVRQERLFGEDEDSPGGGLKVMKE